VTGSDLLSGLWRWARLRGRSAYVVIGALDSDAARAFAARLCAGDALPIPVDAPGPRHADVLVIVGRVGPRLASALVIARRQLAPGAVVLAFDTRDPPLAAVASPDEVVDVDVVVRGMPPSDAMLARALAALAAAFDHADARRDFVAPLDVDAEPP
jgi:hypothetical protein